MGKYDFKPYSKSFPSLFFEEKKRIEDYLKEDVRIEHIGSSAVPGLGGKGIIDILIITENKDEIVDRLLGLGYHFYLSYSTTDRLFLKMHLPDLEEGTRTYHIHVMSFKSEDCLDLLFFRDYLKSHPKDVEKYEEIKAEAALKAHGEGMLYRKLKDPFMKEILDKKKV